MEAHRVSVEQFLFHMLVRTVFVILGGLGVLVVVPFIFMGAMHCLGGRLNDK